MRWDKGRDKIERMLSDGYVQRVPASREHADRLLAEAERHLASAGSLAADDPQGAFALMYDASRKALTAILANQGLRPTTAGGHRAVYDAVCAQFVPPMSATLRPFDRMRRRRAEIEYPDVGTPAVTEPDVNEDVPKARAILDFAADVLDQMSPF